MEKRGAESNFSNEEILFLSHLIESLEESESKLEEYFQKKDYENFNSMKKSMMSISNKIMESIK